jgi:large subunit ribosomal protein L24
MYLHNGKPARLGVQINDGKKVRVAIVKKERFVID